MNIYARRKKNLNESRIQHVPHQVCIKKPHAKNNGLFAVSPELFFEKLSSNPEAQNCKTIQNKTKGKQKGAGKKSGNQKQARKKKQKMQPSTIRTDG